MNTARVHTSCMAFKSTCKFYSMQSKPSSSWLSRCCVTKLNPLCGYSSFQEFVELVSTVYTQALFLFPIMWAARLINYLCIYVCTFPSSYTNFKCCGTPISTISQSGTMHMYQTGIVPCHVSLAHFPALRPTYSNLYHLHTPTKQALFLFPCHVSLTYEVQGCFLMDFLNTSISKCSWLVRSHSVWYRTNGLGTKLLISSSLSKINQSLLSENLNNQHYLNKFALTGRYLVVSSWHRCQECSQTGLLREEKPLNSFWCVILTSTNLKIIFGEN